MRIHGIHHRRLTRMLSMNRTTLMRHLLKRVYPGESSMNRNPQLQTLQSSCAMVVESRCPEPHPKRQELKHVEGALRPNGERTHG